MVRLENYPNIKMSSRNPEEGKAAYSYMLVVILNELLRLENQYSQPGLWLWPGSDLQKLLKQPIFQALMKRLNFAYSGEESMYVFFVDMTVDKNYLCIWEVIQKVLEFMRCKLNDYNSHSQHPDNFTVLEQSICELYTRLPYNPEAKAAAAKAASAAAGLLMLQTAA